jgi:hypothetical protein
MGDGNFGGGGSVRWKINHKKDEDTNGPKQHKGKDKGPLTEIDDKLLVTFKNGRVLQSGPGTVIVEVTLADDEQQVVLKWGDDIAADPILRNLTQQS